MAGQGYVTQGEVESVVNRIISRILADELGTNETLNQVLHEVERVKLAVVGTQGEISSIVEEARLEFMGLKEETKTLYEKVTQHEVALTGQEEKIAKQFAEVEKQQEQVGKLVGLLRDANVQTMQVMAGSLDSEFKVLTKHMNDLTAKVAHIERMGGAGSSGGTGAGGVNNNKPIGESAILEWSG